MATTRTYARSFTGGEVSSQMHGRVDTVQYQTGAKTVRNMLVLPQGAVTKRPGFQTVRASRANAVAVSLFPFRFGADDAVVIEAGAFDPSEYAAYDAAGYFRFHADGQTVLAPVANLYRAQRNLTLTGSTVAPYNVNVGVMSAWPFVTGDPAYLTTTGTMPGGLVAGTRYYVHVVNSSTVRICATASDAAAGTAIPITSVGSGAIALHYDYALGDLVSYLGNTFYARSDRPFAGGASVTPGSVAYWWQMPSTGEYEIPSPLDATELFRATYTQSNDVMTFASRSYYAFELRRYAYADWRLQRVRFAPTLTPPTSVTASSYTGAALKVNLSPNTGLPTSSETGSIMVESYGPLDYWIIGDTFVFQNTGMPQLDNGSLWSLHAKPTQYRAVLTAHNGGELAHLQSAVTTAFWQIAVSGTVVTWASQALSNSAPVVIMNTSNVVLYTGYVVNTAGIWFGVAASPGGAAVNLTSLGVPATARIRLWHGGRIYMQPASVGYRSTNVYVVTAVDRDGVESEASAEVTVTNNLYVTGAYNTISWAAVTGAVRYRIYKQDAGLFGRIGEVDAAVGTSFRDEGPIAPQLGDNPPIVDDTLEDEAPRATAYFDQRRLFGGTVDDPQTVWGTRPGTQSDLTYSLPSRDDDRIKFRIESRENVEIRHIVPLDSLLVLTSGGEFRVSSRNTDGLTPSSIVVRAQSLVGASYVHPEVVNRQVLFCAARGGHMRELGFDDASGGYITGDLSLRAAHLFDGYEIRKIAQMRAPYPIVWAVSSSGLLLGLTYVPEERVGAWHQHTTPGGTFESCAVIAEGDEDRLYVVVNRGGTRYVERMATVFYDAVEDSCFLDASVSEDGAGTTLSLPHLAEEEVETLVDGVAGYGTVDAGGTLTVASSTRRRAGLGYTATLETLPIALDAAAFAQGRAKNVNKMWVRVDASSPFTLGLSGRAPVTLQADPDESREVEALVFGAWSAEGTVTIEQSSPLPLTVVSMTSEVVIGG